MMEKTKNEKWVGKKIRILWMDDIYSVYDGRQGIVKYVDDAGQLHGTWGSLAVIPGVDVFEEIE